MYCCYRPKNISKSNLGSPGHRFPSGGPQEQSDSLNGGTSSQHAFSKLWVIFTTSLTKILSGLTPDSPIVHHFIILMICGSEYTQNWVQTSTQIMCEVTKFWLIQSYVKRGL